MALHIVASVINKFIVNFLTVLPLAFFLLLSDCIEDEAKTSYDPVELVNPSFPFSMSTSR
jgi:hypothetical protein